MNKGLKMDWNEYQIGSQWAIKAIKADNPPENILSVMADILEAKAIVHRGEDWARGAYAILLERGIVFPLGKSEAAKRTGYTRNAIQKAIENGYLKATLVDGHYNIHPLDLEAWQNSDKKRKPYKKVEKP